jgi:colanic acid biosynthesis glycosyl transferase WcaI
MRTATRWLLPLTSVLFLVVFAYLFLPLDDLDEALEEVNYFALGPAIAMYFVSLYFRGVRWRFLLRPVTGEPSRPVFPVIVVGRMAGHILPGKFSGIVRAWYLGIREDSSAASALGTVLAERIIDAIALYLLILFVWLMPGGLLHLLSRRFPGGESLFVVLSLLPVILLVLGMIMVVFAPARTYPLIASRMLFFLPSGIRGQIAGIVERITNGFAVIRSFRVFTVALLLSVPVWAAEVASMGVIGIGFNLNGPFEGWVEYSTAVVLFTAVVNLALIGPSIGGLSGTFTFFGAATLVALGVPDAKSGAYTLMAHLVVIIPVTVLGLIVVARDQVSLRTLLFDRGGRRDRMDLTVGPAIDRPLRILYISQLYDPEPGAQPVRIRQLVQHWAKLGHEVTVLTGFPNHPEGRLFPGWRWRYWKFADSRFEGGVRILRTWLVPRENKGIINRAVGFSSFTVSAVFTSLAIGKVDVVVGTVPQPLSPIAAWLKGRTAGAPFILEIRDLWPEGLLATGQATTSSLSYRGLDLVAKFLYGRADHMVAVTEGIQNYLIEERGISEDRVDVVRAGVAADEFTSDITPEDAKQQWDISGRFIVSYIGTHGNAHDLWTVLRAAKVTASTNPEVLFLFAGGGAEAEQLQEYASSTGLTNVRFLGQIERGDIPSLLNASDVCLATLRDSPVFNTVVPTKLYEYMAAGRPVICSVPGEAAAMIECEGTGLYVPPADPEALAAAVRSLLSDPERRAAMGNAGLRAVRRDTSWESRAAAYLEIMDSVIEHHRGVNAALPESTQPSPAGHR